MTILVIIAILSFVITYTYFTASKQVDGVSFSFSKLNVMYDESWIYTVGTFSQPTETAQMAGYGTFTPDSSGEFIQFGWFPQTIKASNVTITSTTKKFASWDCYVGNDNYLYVKVANPTPYREENSTYSDGTSCLTTTGELYFKLERIIWQILENTSGNKLLFSVKELTAMQYFERGEENATRTIGEETNIYDSNYKYSYIRAYLNGLDTYGISGAVNGNTSEYYYKDKGLLQQAFTTAQSNLIKSTTVDNSATTASGSSDAYACENTTDKIFLLSFKELIDYGNTRDGTITNGVRVETTKFPTDYAGAKGAIMRGIEGEWIGIIWNGGIYWSRSPGRPSHAITAMDMGNTVSNYATHQSGSGVVPALFLNI